MRESCTSGSERGKPCKGLTYLPNFISGDSGIFLKQMRSDWKNSVWYSE